MPHTTKPNPLIALPSTLALWPACYTLGVYLLSTFSLGLALPTPTTIALILLIAHACYLLDRAKLTDARQDPADALALPERSLFYTKFAKPIRILIVIELLAACWLAFSITPLLALVPVGALVGVHFYAGRGATPSKPRIKDIPGLKSFLIAGAHIALVLVILWGNELIAIDSITLQLVLVFVGLWLLVASDATICDLDDRPSDALYSTRSVPVLIGETKAWIFAQSLLLIGAGLLVPMSEQILSTLWILLAIILIGIPTAWVRNRRDLIDARLLPILVVAIAMT